LPGSVNRAEAGFARLMASYRKQATKSARAVEKQNTGSAVRKTA
jgi:hypothetical protein